MGGIRNPSDDRTLRRVTTDPYNFVVRRIIDHSSGANDTDPCIDLGFIVVSILCFVLPSLVGRVVAVVGGGSNAIRVYMRSSLLYEFFVMIIFGWVFFIIY